MKRRKSFKTWEETKQNINERLIHGKHTTNDSELCVASGIQLRHNISHYPSPIVSVTYHDDPKSCAEFYVINYMSTESGESIVVDWKYDPKDGSSKISRKVVIRQSLKFILWIPSQQTFIGYCDDMTLRGYSNLNFEEKTRLSLYKTVMAMIYIEEKDELIMSGQGYVSSWKVKIIEFGLPPEPKDLAFSCDVNDTLEWVERLFYDKLTDTIMALTDETVYIISMGTRRQVDIINNTHQASLTSCSFYKPCSYFITAARDGSVHIFHTVVKALVHKFSAHLVGVTGVSCIWNQPILVSWSHKGGSLRMWRLDTFELANETTLSENIQFLQIVRNDRIYYQTECNVRIFDINILYNVFASLISAIDSFRLCSVRRKADPKQKENISELPSIKSSDDSVQHEKDASSSTTVIDEVSSARDMINTKLDWRIVCVHEDHSVTGISPVTGFVLNIVNPIPKMHKAFVSLDLEKCGKSIYVVYANGSLLEFDCSVNPAVLANTVVPERKQRVLCVVTMEIHLVTTVEKRRQGIFVGLDSGCIKLYDGGLASQEHREIGPGGRRPNTRQRESTINDFGPFLKMENVKAHAGGTAFLHVPYEGAFAVDGLDEPICNVMLSGGTDQKVVIWKASSISTSNPLVFEVVLHKLCVLKTYGLASCLALTDNVIFFGFPNGAIEMLRLKWKSFHSAKGAQITVEHHAFILASLQKITMDRETFHRKKVTCAGESHMLKIFVTSSLDASIKVWDSDGQLVRELLLGHTVPSVCFANGFDILASLRYHIVKIESYRYLPAEYLEKLLDIIDARSDFELVPEDPIPCDEDSDSLVSFFRTGEEQANMGQEKSIILEEKQSKKKALDGSLRKYSTSLAAQNSKAKGGSSDESDTESVVAEEVKFNLRSYLKDETSVERKVDKAADFISTLRPAVIAKHPVAPDGYIQNSVIRRHFSSLDVNLWTMPPFFFGRLQRNKQGYALVLPSDWNTLTRRNAIGIPTNEKQKSQTETPVVLEYGQNWAAAQREHELQLKYYLKMKLQKGKSRKSIFERRASRRLSSPILANEVQTNGSKTESPTKSPTKTGTTAETSSTMNRLNALLKELSALRWCPKKIRVKSLEKGLLSLVDVLSTSSANIVSELCGYVSRVYDACEDVQTDIGKRLFTENLEHVYGNQFGRCILHNFASVQIAAAEALTKFDNQVIKDVLLTCVIPSFVTITESQPLLQSDEKLLANATRGLALLAKNIDVDRLCVISRLAEVNEARGTRVGEDYFVEKISTLLGQEGVHPIEVKAWAAFIIPLLPVKWTKPVESFHPLTETPADQPASPREVLNVRRDASTTSLFATDSNLSAYLHYNDVSKVETAWESDSKSVIVADNEEASEINAYTEMIERPNNPANEQFMVADSGLMADYRKITGANGSLFRPVSLTSTLQRRSEQSSSGLKPAAVRSKESNLRQEIIEVVKVMRRTSEFRSYQDLQRISSSQNVQHSASAAQLTTNMNSSSLPAKHSAMIIPSTGRPIYNSPEGSFLLDNSCETGKHSMKNNYLTSSRFSKPGVTSDEAADMTHVVGRHGSGDTSEPINSHVKGSSISPGFLPPAFGNVHPSRGDADWRGILRHLRNLRLKNSTDDDLKGPQMKSNVLRGQLRSQISASNTLEEIRFATEPDQKQVDQWTSIAQLSAEVNASLHPVVHEIADRSCLQPSDAMSLPSLQQRGIKSRQGVVYKWKHTLAPLVRQPSLNAL